MTKDNINPNHYKIGGIETIDLIQDVVKDFGSVCQANILKYGIRANKKHDEPQDDIKKIIRYCEFWLNDLEGLKASGKRSEEIAVFDKLNSLLTPQEKEFLKDKKFECVFLNGTKIAEEAFEKLIEKINKQRGAHMENKKYSDIIKDLRFTANKLADCVDYANFESLERRKIREVIDILGNKVYEMEDFKNEEEYWS